MPLKSKSQFDSLLAMTALLNNEELEALAFKCEELIKDRERIKREKLRQELIENLQKAIGDILHNGFSLTIINMERDHRTDDFDEVYFDSQDIYSIRIDE